jgi:hypothetical protein
MSNKDINVWKQRNEILHKKVDRQMEEIKNLNKKGETIFDLARKYPTKTYSELEEYRDADRHEEADSIPLTDAQKSLVDEVEKAIDKNKQLSESQKKQEELEPIEGEEQDNPELFGWKEKYDKEHKLRQEAETETILVKGIGMNSPEMKAAKAKIEDLQNSLDRFKKDNNDLFLRIAELTEVEESHRNMNGKLQERLTEVEEDNKKLSGQIEDQLARARKAGL